MIERPVDFSYDACWFECPHCGDRVVMTFEDRDRGESRTCRSGHEVSAQEEFPALTDLAEPATNPAEIEHLVWYHTSARAGWPPTDESLSAVATHLGTFESAIENMFRRMRDQGDADSQFFLHRVRIACTAADVSPLGGELSDLAGNVKLRVLFDARYRVMRYLNVFEHPGSISLVAIEVSSRRFEIHVYDPERTELEVSGVDDEALPDLVGKFDAVEAIPCGRLECCEIDQQTTKALHP